MLFPTEKGVLETQPSVSLLTQERDAVLTIDVHGAKGLPKRGWGKQDPFVVVRYSDHQLQSTIAYEAGSNPEWDDKFHFKEEFDCDAPEIYVKDQTLFSDILIGVAKVPLESVLADKCVATIDLPIKDPKRGIQCGTLTVNVCITPVQHVSPHILKKLPYSFSPKATDELKRIAYQLNLDRHWTRSRYSNSAAGDDGMRQE